MADPVLPEIQVHLLEPVGGVKGRAWPTRSDGAPLRLTAIEEPSKITIVVPSGRRLNFRARSALLRQNNGVVVGVTVLPLEQLVSYGDAVSSVSAIASSLGIEDEKFLKRLKGWLDADALGEVPSAKRSARALLEPKVAIFVEIKPHTNGKGWYASVTLSRAVEAD